MDHLQVSFSNALNCFKRKTLFQEVLIEIGHSRLEEVCRICFLIEVKIKKLIVIVGRLCKTCLFWIRNIRIYLLCSVTQHDLTSKKI